ncbi:hypothetical protein Sango_2327200 [Sesamum angolense]|uniref:DUF8003 domain-containing protein n=1 Tax=Sesamum angolense TaxID=2727404 RepID=A0AAE1WAQ1_9LAMI|nr:hypothetical protein Sango_2327200 [Sesamum angolense]
MRSSRINLFCMVGFYTIDLSESSKCHDFQLQDWLAGEINQMDWCCAGMERNASPNESAGMWLGWNEGGFGGSMGGGWWGVDRIHFHWINASYWDGICSTFSFVDGASLYGGAGSGNGLHGEKGTITGKKCPKGLYGTFCTECPVGTYKDDEGSDPNLCKPCSLEHLPARANFVYVRGCSYNGDDSIEHHDDQRFPYLLSLSEVRGAKSEESQSHVHRMYFGSQYIQGTLASSLLTSCCIFEIVYEDAFNRFIDEINSVAAYEWWEGRKKIHRLQEFVKSEYDHSCLRSCRSRALYKGMKLGILVVAGDYTLYDLHHSEYLDISNATSRNFAPAPQNSSSKNTEESQAYTSHVLSRKKVTGGFNGGVINEATLKSLGYKRDFLFPFSLLLRNTRPVGRQDTVQLLITVMLLADLFVTLLMLLMFYWISLGAFLAVLLILPLSLLSPFPAGLNALFTNGPRRASLARVYALWNSSSISNCCGIYLWHDSLCDYLSELPRSECLAFKEILVREDGKWWLLPTILLLFKIVQARFVDWNIANLEVKDFSLFSPDPDTFWAYESVS